MANNDFVSGLLGGVMGTANAVNELSAERRKEMAIALRREALAELDRQSTAQKHGYDVELQGRDIAARKTEGEADRSSREGMADARIKSMEKLSQAEMDMKNKLLSMDKKSTKAQMVKTKISAFSEARKLLENGGTTAEANIVLEAAGLPLMEDVIVEEGREGILGFFAKDPVVERRVEGSGGPGLASPGPQAGGEQEPEATGEVMNAEGGDWVQNLVDEFNAEGNKSDKLLQTAEASNMPDENAGMATPMDMESTPQETPQAESQAIANTKPTGYQVDGKEIVSEGDNIYVIEDGKPRPITPEEWERRKIMPRKPSDKKKAVSDIQNLPGKIEKASKENPNPLYGR